MNRSPPQRTTTPRNASVAAARRPGYSEDRVRQLSWSAPQSGYVNSWCSLPPADLVQRNNVDRKLHRAIVAKPRNASTRKRDTAYFVVCAIFKTEGITLPREKRAPAREVKRDDVDRKLHRATVAKRRNASTRKLMR
eukprot:6213228-Pleurochrysis_carterae.AAC.1